MTLEASRRLFALADTPETMRTLPGRKIEQAIYPAGFYRRKSRQILDISQILMAQYGGSVPRSEEALLALPGVGRKTANLVLGLGFGIPSICVDTHVHRISNRMGWVQTKTPEETEMALRLFLPEKYWIAVNSQLVVFGQHICKPLGPLCSQCPFLSFCPRKNVASFKEPE